MTERDLRNIAAVRRFYAAEREAAAPDIVWHVPGHNPVSGVYRGEHEYFELLPSRMAPLTAWTSTWGMSWSMVTTSWLFMIDPHTQQRLDCHDGRREALLVCAG